MRWLRRTSDVYLSMVGGGLILVRHIYGLDALPEWMPIINVIAVFMAPFISVALILAERKLQQ